MLDSGTLARMVKFHRKAAGLSRVALAELAGVGKTVIFDIEHGKRTVRIDRLAAVLHALNIRPSWDSPLIGVFRRQENDGRGEGGADA
jgi:transcriptional regulator with XRE-family HTH domain